ncbi:DUF679 domain-containing protein [Heracleum sosnowskyi]|uniref:DUF679 domain-containing protein n=1 Tax=Heracleum sosnowskyi TaxID=360622 RepID=A0AAD8IUP6_9APIA|nr:DUF679 domain-containing protein [Heracleum sosnowskyi]
MEHQQNDFEKVCESPKSNMGKGRSKFVNFLNTIISGTARLNVLLPSATILAFTNFSPLIINEGQCDHLDRWILGLFLTLSSLFCIFFSLTDSFRTSKGRLYYGIATFSGILSLNGTQKKPLAPFEYRLRWADLFHAILSLVAFLTFAASQKDVVDCYYPHLPRKVSYIVPVLIESVIGTLIILFPSGRKGIGYLYAAALHEGVFSILMNNERRFQCHCPPIIVR